MKRSPLNHGINETLAPREMAQDEIRDELRRVFKVPEFHRNKIAKLFIGEIAKNIIGILIKYLAFAAVNK